MTADITPKIVQFVRSVVGAMGLPLQVDVEPAADAVRLNLSGEGGEILIRRKGEALDALQHVANTVFRRELGHDRHVVIDCMSFRRDKDAELRQMAHFLGERAKTSGESQEIGPLNPYARRIVHLAIAEDPTLTSESVGDAFLKTVIISSRKV